MTPDPVTPAVGTIAQSHQFSDLEKVLLLVILAALLAGGYVAWRSGGWIVRTFWPETKDLIKQLVSGIAELKVALVQSDAAHAARVDRLSVEMKTEAQAVGAKVDTLGGTVRELGTKVDGLSKSVDGLGEEVGRRLSGAEDTLTETRLDMARAGLLSQPEIDQPRTEQKSVRTATQPRMRAVGG